MAGSANPAMVQGGAQSAIALRQPQAFTKPIGNMSRVPQDVAQVTNAGPRVPQGGPQNMVAQPLNNSMANPYNQASQAQQAAMGTTANMLGATAAGGMSAYQNPYQQQVIDATLRDIGGAQQQAVNTLGAQATQAKAFGGSRHGIAEAESNKGFNQQAIDATARLRQQGFNTALGASQADMQRQLGAAQQLAGMGQQSFGYGQAIQNQQMQQGAMQQQMMQNLINAAKQQYAGYVGQPNQAMNTFMSGISGMPNMGGQTTSNNPGLFNYLQLGASLMPTR